MIEISKKYGDRTHRIVIEDIKKKKSVSIPIKSKLSHTQIADEITKKIIKQ